MGGIPKDRLDQIAKIAKECQALHLYTTDSRNEVSNKVRGKVKKTNQNHIFSKFLTKKV